MDEYDKGYSRHSFYNIAHVLALYKSHWAAMTKIFIYLTLYKGKISVFILVFKFVQPGE